MAELGFKPKQSGSRALTLNHYVHYIKCRAITQHCIWDYFDRWLGDKTGGKETSSEATAIVLAGDDDGPNQGSGSRIERNGRVAKINTNQQLLVRLGEQV